MHSLRYPLWTPLPPVKSAAPVSRSSRSAAKFGPQDLTRALRQISVGLEGREERQVPAVSGVSPASDQLKDRPNLRFGRLVY